jgi:hypothetical protein
LFAFYPFCFFQDNKNMVFCDWLSIYQEHFKPIPALFSGRIFSVSQDGEIQWDIPQKLVHTGSFDTKLRISSDGNRVTFEGNIGRFNRGDNVFGYSVADCIALANKVLEGFGLPPFTDGKSMPVFRCRATTVVRIDKDRNVLPVTASDLNISSDSDAGFKQTGAVITRVDLTRNWASGSTGNASQVIRYMQGFKSGKFEPKPYHSCGVSWGEGSKFWYAKVYDKAADYLRHYGVGSEHHNPILYDFILNAGVVRHEITLKSRYLRQKSLSRISHWVAGMEDKIYALFNDPIAATVRVDEYLEIPGRAGELAVAWRDGADLKKRLSKVTFYKYRKELLQFGIDIAVPSNVARLKTRVEVITLTPLNRPAWYDLPKVA